MKKVAILGSTGSIGTQTLDVISNNPDKFAVHSLVAYSNKQLLDRQIKQFTPQYSALIELDGIESLIDAVKGCDIAVVATRGIVALDAVLYCIRNNIDVALANKETLVCAGALVIDALKQSKSHLFPVDSEHCAIWQCLDNVNKPTKILLTASGGAFWDKDTKFLQSAKAVDALKHPNWDMGAKITIDSATMMNKALEVIEASWLFGVPVDNIQIVVHRQSVVHSMVQYADDSVIAQMANPDMRLPIQYALTYPSRFSCMVKPLDWTSMQLTFENVDLDKFPCASFGHIISKLPPIAPTVMNGANDICVEAFLKGKIAFCDFFDIINKAIKHFLPEITGVNLSVDTIKQFDTKAKKYTRNLIYGE